MNKFLSSTLAIFSIASLTACSNGVRFQGADPDLTPKSASGTLSPNNPGNNGGSGQVVQPAVNGGSGQIFQPGTNLDNPPPPQPGTPSGPNGGGGGQTPPPPATGQPNPNGGNGQIVQPGQPTQPGAPGGNGGNGEITQPGANPGGGSPQTPGAPVPPTIPTIPPVPPVVTIPIIPGAPNVPPNFPPGGGHVPVPPPGGTVVSFPFPVTPGSPNLPPNPNPNHSPNPNPGGTTPNNPGPGCNDNNPPPTQPHPKLHFRFMCPVFHNAHSSATLNDIKGDVKFLITKMDGTTILCEIDNVRQELEKSRTIDISSCPTGLYTPGQDKIFIVPDGLTSNFESENVIFTGQTWTYFYGENGYLNGEGITVPYPISYTEPSAADSVNCDGADPLALELSPHKAPELTSPENGVWFDLLGAGGILPHDLVKTAWFARTDHNVYFLALPDENGNVKGIDQLFGGNSTKGPNGEFTSDGFAALAKYDSNGDQKITAADPIFSKLRLWHDANSDGVAQDGELYTLQEKGVVAIHLNYNKLYLTIDQYGNKINYKAEVEMSNHARGSVYDLWLQYLIK